MLVVCMFSPSADTCFLDCQVVLSCSISLQVKALKDFFDMLSNVSSYFLNILNRVILVVTRVNPNLDIRNISFCGIFNSTELFPANSSVSNNLITMIA
mgnify:FL=1